MGFREAVRTCLIEKYVRLSGRASRSEYWFFILFCWIVTLLVTLVIGLIGGASFNLNVGEEILFFHEEENDRGIILWIVLLVLFFPWISVSTRRFHDINLSGYWYLGSWLASLIPILGFLVPIGVIVVAVIKGTNGNNKFGPDPLAENNMAQFLPDDGNTIRSPQRSIAAESFN